MKRTRAPARAGFSMILGVLFPLVLVISSNSSFATGKQKVATRSSHARQVYNLAFSPDSKLLASASEDNTIKIWDTASGQELRAIGVKNLNSVTFSPDGKILATFQSSTYGSAKNYTIQIWDVGSGKELRTLKGHSDGVYSLAFSPDGKTLASNGFDKNVRLWDLSSGKTLHILPAHGYSSPVAFSPDNKTIASVGMDGAVMEFWDVASGKKVRKLAASPSGINKIAFSPDGKLVASAASHELKVWDVVSGNKVHEFTTRSDDESVNSLAFNSGGDGLISVDTVDDGTGGWIRNVSKWDMKTGKISSVGNDAKFRLVGVSSDGKMLATVSFLDSDNIKLRDASGKELRRLIGAPGSISFSRPADHPLHKLTSLGGVKIGQIKYLAPETKRDLQLERVLKQRFYPQGVPAEDPPVNYVYNKADLNGDGIPELIVLLWGKNWCGSGGTTCLVIQPSSGYKVIDKLGVTYELPIVSDQKTKGWSDLIWSVSSGGSSYYAVNKWAGSHYSESVELKAGQTINGTDLSGYEGDGIKLH